MKFCTTLAGSTALAVVLLAQTAAADVTPEEVWADLRGYMEGYGYEITGSESTSGDRLTVSDIAMTIPIPEDNATLRMTIPEMTFTADGGAVDVAMPESLPMVIEMSGEEGSFTATLRYETPGLDMTVSGAENDTAWAYSADSIRVTLEELVADGTPIGRDTARGEVVFDGVTGTSSMRTGELRDLAQEVTVASLSYDIAARDPENAENTMLLKGAMSDITYGGTGTLPLEVDPEDPAALMAVMNVDGSFAYAGGTSQFSFTDEGETVNYQSSSDSGTFGVAMTPDSWSYDVLVKGYDVQVQGGDVPFPVALSAGEIGGNLTMPVARTEEPVDFAAGLNLTDFTMNDLIWNIFDPGAQMPRDPATMVVDLSGKAKMLFDIYDPEQAEAMAMAEMPAELHSLTLDKLMVNAVGAMLTGTGAFTFDTSDMQTFPGMPRPEGEVNAELTGANALLDRLVAMGFVPEDQAMGMRMMMGMFAVSAGDDKLTSTLEINDQGHVIANGQRIQ